MSKLMKIYYTEEEIAKLANDFVGFLTKKNLLDVDKPSEYTKLTCIILNRQLIKNEMVSNLAHYISKIYQKTMSKVYNGDSTKFISGNHLVFLHYIPMVHSHYELFKRELYCWLDTNKLKINDESTYGTIVGRLRDRELSDDIYDILNTEMRNTLAHESWKIDNNDEFCFEDPNIKNLPFDEFLELFSSFHTFVANVTGIMVCYDKEFGKQVRRETRDILGV